MRDIAPSPSNNNERIILFFVLGFGLVTAALFCGLLFVLHTHDTEVASELPVRQAHPVILATPMRHLADFTLTDENGHTVTRKDLNGDFLVMSFVFTTCSTTCPIISQRMKEIQQLITNQPDVRLVTVTVDPEDDTAPVLAKYGRRFSADTNRWNFLTGGDDMVQNLVGSILPRDTNSAFSYLPGNYAHSDSIALVNPRGQVLGYFDGLDVNTPKTIVQRIAELREQYQD